LETGSAIVGSGFAGRGTAARLRERGLGAFLVLERAHFRAEDDAVIHAG
jgi:cation diffusion facilitator CzcD-associated flavoprotein CzcO